MTAVIYISGFVQGVGFRKFVKKEAQKLHLTGYVKNLPDGRVEVLVQSSASFHSDDSSSERADQEAKENIEKLIKHSEKGSFISEVENVVVNWIDISQEFNGFEILR